MLILFALLFLLTVFLTGQLRRYALNRALLDIPNERSSHTLPTPRGGGLAIVIVILLGVLFASLIDEVPHDLAIAILVGGSAIALLGWLDDHRDLSAAIRASVQGLVAVWLVFYLGGFSTLTLGHYDLHLGGFGSFLAAIACVWLINLYNFMDGTDGIASVQALSAAGLGLGLFLLSGDVGAALVCIMILATCAGFLMWNWSPARIFMGDVGSSFLGYMFAVLALYGEQTQSVPVLMWMMLLAGFLMDSTLTLLKRVKNGERWYAAHRSHAYQRYVQLGHTHAQLAVRFSVLNLIVIWPMVIWAFYKPKLLIWLTLMILLLCSMLWLLIQKRYDSQQ